MPWSATTFAALCGVLVLAAVLCRTFYVGFIASDDVLYLQGALGWLNDAPYLGVNHWTLRHPIVLPLAGLVGSFGAHEWVLTAWPLAAYFLLLLVNAWFIQRFLGAAVAVVAVLLMAVAPGIALVATQLFPDVPEVLYISTLFWSLLWLKQDRAARPWAWAGLGALAAIALLNRQTSASILIFAAGLFLWSPGVSRRRWWPALLSLVAVMAAEWAYVAVLSGDPLYRFKLDFNHDPVTRTMELARVSGKLFDGDGNFAVNIWVDPVLNIALSQKYPLLFWLALPGVWWAWQQRQQPEGRVALAVLAFAAVAFVWVGYNPKLLLVKRYFMPVAWALTVIAAFGIVSLWQRGWRWSAAVTLAVAVTAGLAALSVERTNPRMAERELVRWVTEHPSELVYTDPETRLRAKALFAFARVPMDTVLSSPVPSGSVYFYSAEGVDACYRMRRCPGRSDADLRPQADWMVLEQIKGPRKPLGRLLAGLGLEHAMPPELGQKFFGPTGSLTIYRRP